MSPDPRDLLPQPPWEGPPVPQFFKEWYYIQSFPAKDYLYHHSYYSALKDIARVWAIRSAPGKYSVSLTTDPGRYLSPLPIIVAVTVDGVVQIPYNEEVRGVTIPCLYRTKKTQLVEEAKARGYGVFVESDLPLEYRYIMRWVVHNDMFVNENEHVAIGPHFSPPSESIIYVHPKKYRRFIKDLGPYTVRIRSLEELTP